MEGQTVPQLECSIAEGSVFISFKESSAATVYFQMSNGGPSVSGFAEAALPDIQVPGPLNMQIFEGKQEDLIANVFTHR